jgi:lipopolysaccharide/colanic/teichoic acid biosynthesis glycosyltransferase
MGKRLLDIVLASVGLLIFLPLGIAIALVLRFSGEGEVFYRQKRVGRDGKQFDLFKFATMLKASPSLGTRYLTIKNDPRILPVGKFLRKTKLNEVPQLLNVLRGDMSMVGPRPQAEPHFMLFAPHVRDAIVTVRPGITSLAAIVFRDEENLLAAAGIPEAEFYAGEISAYKGELELWYVRNRSWRLDVLLILLTAWAVVAPRSRLWRRLLRGVPQAPSAVLAA